MARKPTGNPASTVLAIRISAAYHQVLERRAAETGETVNDVHRAFVEEGILKLQDEYRKLDTLGSNMTHDPSAGLLTVQPNPTLDA